MIKALLLFIVPYAVFTLLYLGFGISADLSTPLGAITTLIFYFLIAKLGSIYDEQNRQESEDEGESD